MKLRYITNSSLEMLSRQNFWDIRSWLLEMINFLKVTINDFSHVLLYSYKLIYTRTIEASDSVEINDYKSHQGLGNCVSSQNVLDASQ